MDNSIYILHLSDLHIDPCNPGESKPLFDSLCKKLESFGRTQHGSFGLLVISGDLVDKGAADYTEVEERIEELRRACGIEKDKVFFVPGNHDIDRDKYENNDNSKIKPVVDKPDIMSNLSTCSRVFFQERFAAYSRFANSFSLDDDKTYELPGFFCKDMDLTDDIPVRVCGINTALAAGKWDYQVTSERELKNRVAGMQILVDFLNRDNHRNRMKLVISHYPISWINDLERYELTTRLQNLSAIFLHGHMHNPAADISGIAAGYQVLIMGVGSLYGNTWLGRNHSQILELNPRREKPILHEWLWFSHVGWRKLEPQEIEWTGWRPWWETFQGGDKICRPSLSYFCQSGVIKGNPTICDHTGIISAGKNREKDERKAYITEALTNVVPSSEFIAVGRSLHDVGEKWEEIEEAINNKNIRVRLALLDENTIIDKSLNANHKNYSWIEKPIPEDWAFEHVKQTMKNFHRIQIRPQTGSLQVFGLPFYVTHSFISYEDQRDNKRYCLEEAGIARKKEKRPYIELQDVSVDSYGGTLKRMYTSFMTNERLILYSDDNGEIHYVDTTKRCKIIAPKIEKFGLIDLGINYDTLEWPGKPLTWKDQIENVTPDGEIFIVGRSLFWWTTPGGPYQYLPSAIQMGLKCTFVVADPTDDNVISPVKGDKAFGHVRQAYEFFENEFIRLLKKAGNPCKGTFKLYAIPCYVPSTFALYNKNLKSKEPNGSYCTLEPGIWFTRDMRPILCFENVSNNDIFTYLNRIYRKFIEERKPLVEYP